MVGLCCSRRTQVLVARYHNAICSVTMLVKADGPTGDSVSRPQPLASRDCLRISRHPLPPHIAPSSQSAPRGHSHRHRCLSHHAPSVPSQSHEPKIAGHHPLAHGRPIPAEVTASPAATGSDPSFRWQLGSANRQGWGSAIHTAGMRIETSDMWVLR